MSEETGWLQISTQGFAALNQSRPPQELVKELVQNALDAIGDNPGSVKLNYKHEDGKFKIQCIDTGNGIENLGDLRIVYLTTKKNDSHLQRGRFGRGFKEILCVAQTAKVSSGNHTITFMEKDGIQKTQQGTINPPIKGTVVSMIMNWDDGLIPEFDNYFNRFLIPDNINFQANGRNIEHREVKYSIKASLPTEVFDHEKQTWKKPTRRTRIELVPIKPEETPFLYEMGIPIAEVGWTIPFHANVSASRVLMNPNRDAFASGYGTKVHTACLPTVLSDLNAEQIKSDWVGIAGAQCEERVQKQIIHQAFGERVVRSVPSMGKRDFDSNAERELGAEVIKTTQISGGFREMIKAHVPTSKEVVEKAATDLAKRITEEKFSPEDVKQNQNNERQQWIEKRGGEARVSDCLEFSTWFCQQILDHSKIKGPAVRGHVALGRKPHQFGPILSQFIAHWSSENDLTLALETDCFWENPTGAETIRILIHESSHAMNQHHGRSFHEEVERLGGVAAEIMFVYGNTIRKRWGHLIPSRWTNHQAS